MEYIISTTIYLLKGTYVTISLYLVTAIFSMPLSILFAALQFSAPKFVRYIFDIYAWLFRGTPFEPSYTELNGKYYRTFNSTYPMPPIKEIMETVDRFETNFTVTEEHIKKSGYYQLQVSSVAPDKAQESDWVNIMPNNETTSSIGWESGGADLFTLDGKIVRLVDYDREFKLNNQYETALALAEKYYNLLLNSPMSEFKKYDYYFLYYKAMADMLKIIKDKGNNYFRPDEAVTHYTFEL